MQVLSPLHLVPEMGPCFYLPIKYFISRVLSLGSVSRATSNANNCSLSSLYYLKPDVAKATGGGRALLRSLGRESGALFFPEPVEEPSE